MVDVGNNGDVADVIGGVHRFLVKMKRPGNRGDAAALYITPTILPSEDMSVYPIERLIIVSTG